MEDKKKTEGSIDPVNIEGTKKILAQLMNCICKIQIKGTYATGFFCKFSHKKQAIKVFMTNYHVLNEKDFGETKKLNLSLNDEKETKTIDLSIERKTYFNKDKGYGIYTFTDIIYLESEVRFEADEAETNTVSAFLKHTSICNFIIAN